MPVTMLLPVSMPSSLPVLPDSCVPPHAAMPFLLHSPVFSPASFHACPSMPVCLLLCMSSPCPDLPIPTFYRLFLPATMYMPTSASVIPHIYLPPHPSCDTITYLYCIPGPLASFILLPPFVCVARADKTRSDSCVIHQHHSRCSGT